MTIGYMEVLYGTLSLNLIAVAYRCGLFGRQISDSAPKNSHKARSPRKIIQDGSSGDDTSSTFSDVSDDNEESSRTDAGMARRHRNLLYFTYLPVYLLATAADWLQGPYKYAVCKS